MRDWPGSTGGFSADGISLCTVRGFLCDVSIILKHRTATSHVDDYRIQTGHIKGGRVPGREIQGRPLCPAVIVNCPAADLALGDDDVAPVGLQDPRGSP